MIRTLKLEDVNPRNDTATIQRRVQEFLDSCDPDARVEISLEVAER